MGVQKGSEGNSSAKISTDETNLFLPFSLLTLKYKGFIV